MLQCEGMLEQGSRRGLVGEQEVGRWVMRLLEGGDQEMGHLLKGKWQRKE